MYKNHESFHHHPGSQTSYVGLPVLAHYLTAHVFSSLESITSHRQDKGAHVFSSLESSGQIRCGEATAIYLLLQMPTVCTA